MTRRRYQRHFLLKFVNDRGHWPFQTKVDAGDAESAEVIVTFNDFSGLKIAALKLKKGH